MPNLEVLGWNDFFASQLSDDETAAPRFAARIIEEQKRYYRLAGAHGEVWAEPTGKLTHAAVTRADLPAVGDWVVASSAQQGRERGTIERILKRRTKLSRRAAGEGEREQIVAANIDVVFIATSLNQDLNLERLKRYLEMVQLSGAQPVIVLTKRDLCADVEAKMQAVGTVAGGAAAFSVSVRTNEGMDELTSFLSVGKTAAFVGSSGVGKSTLINWLARQELQITREVREDDDRGRHTTTYRRLIVLPEGLMIDTPGMRELQAWTDEGAGDTYDDVVALAVRCRFSNCAHVTEPGCAVKAAIEGGVLTSDRLTAYFKTVADAKAGQRR